MEDNFKYITVMFPYPSGALMHMGHAFGYCLTDSYVRYLRYKGEKVFFPFGFDAHGLPAENYARQIGGDPKEITLQNIERFRNQMKEMKTDYEDMLSTCDDDYVKFIQWFFNKLLEKGLAYKKEGEVDYCPSCETTLAKEQIKEGKCERCKSVAQKKVLNQWYFKITDYKQRLIDDLEKIDYPQSTIAQQRVWLENQHDWCVSRQRKWGCPIPVDGETDTLDTFVDSSIYTIYYCIKKGIKPRPVDLYIGGSEHATGHLIYSRFCTKFLFDIGFIDFDEPFKKIVHQGMILNNGVKMSKSLGNVVNPTDYPQHIIRLYLMFIGFFFDGGSWSDQNINGIKRFFERWKLWMSTEGDGTVDVEKFKTTISNYTEAFKFNKVVSEFMTLLKNNKNTALKPEIKKQLNELLNIYAPDFDKA